MWRPAHGGTNRPGHARPGSGYGRLPGRPGPGAHRWAAGTADAPERDDPADLVGPADPRWEWSTDGGGVDTPAPLTQ